MKEQEELLKSRKGPEKAGNPWIEVMQFVDEKRVTTKDTGRMLDVMTRRKNDKL